MKIDRKIKCKVLPFHNPLGYWYRVRQRDDCKAWWAICDALPRCGSSFNNQMRTLTWLLSNIKCLTLQAHVTSDGVNSTTCTWKVTCWKLHTAVKPKPGMCTDSVYILISGDIAKKISCFKSIYGFVMGYMYPVGCTPLTKWSSAFLAYITSSQLVPQCTYPSSKQNPLPSLLFCVFQVF